MAGSGRRPYGERKALRPTKGGFRWRRDRDSNPRHEALFAGLGCQPVDAGVVRGIVPAEAQVQDEAERLVADASSQAQPSSLETTAAVTQAVPSAPETPAPPLLPGPKVRVAPDDKRRTMRSYGYNLVHNFASVVQRDNHKPLLITAALTAASFTVDNDLEDYFHNHPHDDFARIGANLGGSVAVGAVTVGLFSAGRVARGDRFRAASYDLSQAIILTQVYTTALKVVVQRERPGRVQQPILPLGARLERVRDRVSDGAALPQACRPRVCLRGLRRRVSHGCGKTPFQRHRCRERPGPVHWTRGGPPERSSTGQHVRRAPAGQGDLGRHALGRSIRGRSGVDAHGDLLIGRRYHPRWCYLPRDDIRASQGGGERGIRTLGTGVTGSRDFQSRRFNHSRISPSLSWGALWPRLAPPALRGLAERVGFEPTVPGRAQRFSRPPDSTTLAPLRAAQPRILAWRRRPVPRQGASGSSSRSRRVKRASVSAAGDTPSSSASAPAADERPGWRRAGRPGPRGRA